MKNNIKIKVELHAVVSDDWVNDFIETLRFSLKNDFGRRVIGTTTLPLDYKEKDTNQYSYEITYQDELKCLN